MGVTHDLVVLGLGGMGSAALARAALRGRRVLGIEQFARGHELGSSCGRSRIIRKAYFEDPAYVPLLLRAYELWRDLETRTGATLLDLIGVLMVGNAQSTILANVESTARAYGLALEQLDGPEIARRFSGTRPRPGERAVLERDAGVVFPEAAIGAHLSLAERNGADLRFETRVAGYDPLPDGIRVRLADGETLQTARLAVCAGPWLAALAAELLLPLRVQRNVQLWFWPSTPAFGAGRFPAFFVDRPDWPAPLYGFPDYGDGVKAALHAYGESTVPAELDRSIRAADIATVADLLAGWMPEAAGAYAGGRACMYTLTPDEHFIIDRHPADPRIVLAGGFSGHGYKFCSVVGEIVTELAFDGGTRHPIAFLSLHRFARGHASRK